MRRHILTGLTSKDFFGGVARLVGRLLAMDNRRSFPRQDGLRFSNVRLSAGPTRRCAPVTDRVSLRKRTTSASATFTQYW